jgi:hypothetical protein
MCELLSLRQTEEGIIWGAGGNLRARLSLYAGDTPGALWCCVIASQGRSLWPYVIHSDSCQLSATEMQAGVAVVGKGQS